MISNKLYWYISEESIVISDVTLYVLGPEYNDTYDIGLVRFSKSLLNYNDFQVLQLPEYIVLTDTLPEL